MKNKLNAKLQLVIATFSASLVVLVSFLSAVHASSIQHVQIDDMLSMAELVFEGTVVSKTSRWNDNNTFIHTYITFDVDDVVVGDYNQSTLELRFDGGTVDDMAMLTEGSVFPEVGEKGIYFVETINAYLVNPLVGWSQGHFLLEQDIQGNERVMTNQKEMVMDIESPSQNMPMLSNGVAGGVRTSAAKSDVAESMKKTDFKQALKNKMRAIEANKE